MAVRRVFRSGGPAAKAARRHYEGTVESRLTGPAVAPIPADQIVARHHRALVGRSRQQAATNDYMRDFLRMVRLNVVGPQGVGLQGAVTEPDGDLDQGANDAIEGAWRRWGAAGSASVDGCSSWRAIQRALIMSAAKDGEFFLRVVIGGEDAGAWGFALQVIDPQRVPVDLNEDGLSGGRFVRHGIEFSRAGRPLAYYVSTTDQSVVFRRWHSVDLERVPAHSLIHGFDPVMVDQRRGLPWAATALWRMQMLGGYEQAALVNARAGAAKGGWLQWREGFEPDPSEAADRSDVEMEVEPGLWQELPPGLEARPSDPAYPSGEFATFVKSMLRGVAAGMGVAYNSLARDLEGVNLSSIRHGALEERAAWMDLQEWFIETACVPVYGMWLRVQLLAGRIRLANGSPLPPRKLDKFLEVVWQPRRWDWIDPLKEINAAVTARDNLLVSPGQLIRERGRDPDTVWREVARDIEGMRSAGIPEEFIGAAINSKLAAGGSNAPNPQGGGSAPPDDDD